MKRRTYGARGFDGAQGGRTVEDWLRTGSIPADDIRAALEGLRSRSRDLYQNNANARGWFRRLEKNVVGYQGIRLQSRSASRETARAIEAAWKRWGRRGSCTVCGRHTFRSLQKMALTSLARDGEVLLRLLFGRAAGNSFGFAIQILDPAQLDQRFEGFSGERPIVMGVEQTPEGRPVAYHVLETDLRGRSYQTGRRRRLAAREVVHGFESHYAGQSRGVPWLHAAMGDSRQHQKYREAELIAARIGASKVGFYTNKNGAEIADYDGDDPEALPTEALEPGTFHELPPGVEVQPWDTDHPNTGFADFEKAILRSIAASVGASYVSYANDLEGVSYSSIRQGTLDERDSYREAQALLCEQVLDPIFDAWLATQSAAGRVPYEPDIEWQPRGWSWVDPKKEAEGAILELGQGLTTRAALYAARGMDLEETLEQIRREKELLAEYGIEAPEGAGETGQNPPETDEDGEED